MSKFFALVVSLLVAMAAISLVQGRGMDELRAKIGRRFPLIGGHHHSNHHAPQTYGRYQQVVPGSGAAAASSAAASGGYGGSAAASSAAAASNGAPQYGGYMPAPQYAPRHYPAPRPVMYSPQYQNHGANGAAAAAAAAAAAGASGSATAAAAATADKEYFEPMRPVVNMDRFRGHNMALQGARHAPRFHYNAPSYGGGSAAASSAAAAGGSAAASGAASGGAGGAAAASSAASSGHDFHDAGVAETDYNYEYNPKPTSYVAATGTYADNGDGFESSSYKRSTENLENVEHGHANDDHYYNAQSYGKAQDESEHEAFNKDFEDVIHTPGLYRSKKNKMNYVSTKNKNYSESGSGVLAKDRHNSAYHKNTKKFREDVDQANRRSTGGMIENAVSSSHADIDNDDEMIYDSDNVGGFHGPSGSAAAASAAASGNAAAAAAAAAADAAYGH